MDSSQVVVKQETDVEGADLGGGTITKLCMKYEQKKSGTSIGGTATDRPTATITTTTAQFEVKSEPLEEQVFDDEISTVNNFSDSFLIYELEEAPRIHSVPTTTTTTKPTIINSNLRKKRALTESTKTQSLVGAKRPALETDVATTVTVATTTTPTSSAAATTTSTTTKTLPLSSHKPASIELKVKCLCRLGNPVAASATNMLDLKNFFDEMFNETRQLNRGQQREIKMALLKAISEAEEHLDAGRWCDKCCI